MTLELRNPHSVLATLRHRPQDVLEVRAPPQPADVWAEVCAAAAEQGVALRDDDRVAARRRATGPRREATGSALVKEGAPESLSALFAEPAPDGRYLALDQVQDPHNVGAIVRTAAFFGVRGIVLPRDRTAPLSAVVYDVASGGMEAVPFTVVPNLRRALAAARDAGIWLLGTSEHAATPIGEAPRDRPWLVVVGNEERGLRRLTLERCDLVCRIPGAGDDAPVTSLNVSVSTGVVLAALRA